MNKLFFSHEANDSMVSSPSSEAPTDESLPVDVSRVIKEV